MESIKLKKFLQEFIGNIDLDNIDNCITDVASKFDYSKENVADIIMQWINNETTKCLHHSKNKTLFDYQLKIVTQFYSTRGTIAAFATGTGKTLTATASAACVHNLATKLGKRCNILIVTPASLVDNMKEEFEKFNYNFGNDLMIISSNIFRDILLYKKRIKEGVAPNADKFMLIFSHFSQIYQPNVHNIGIKYYYRMVIISCLIDMKLW